MDDITKQSFNAIPTKSGISEKQGSILYHLAKECKNPIIEYGSLRGRSTTAIAGGSRAGNKVLVNAVDTFAFKDNKALSEDEQIERSKGIESRVKFNVKIFKKHMKSAKLTDLVKVNVASLYDFEYTGKVGMVFVDADKQRAGLQAVWNRHWDSLDSGGWFVSHDFFYRITDGKEDFKGVKDFFTDDIYPKIKKEINNIEIKARMLLIKKP